MTESLYIDPESGGIVPIGDFESNEEEFGEAEDAADPDMSTAAGEEEVVEDQIQLLYPDAPSNLFLVKESAAAGRYTVTVGFDEVATAVEYEVRVTKV